MAEELSPDTIETNILGGVKTTEDLALLLKEHVTEEYWVVYPEVFTYLVSHVKMYNEIPAKEVLESKADDLKLPDKVTGLSSWIDELVRLHVYREGVELLEKHLNTGRKFEEQPKVQLRSLIMDVHQLLKSNNLNTSRVDKDSLNRADEYLERKRIVEEGGRLGMKTGWKCFDDFQEGWYPGECIMIMAPKGIGKSWCLINFAVHAYVDGNKVLFLSPEMSWEECALRFDVFMMEQLGIDIQGGHRELKEGNPHIDIEAYKAYLVSIQDREDFVVVDSDEVGGFTLASITSLIEEHQPDIVILDGIHLIREDKKEQWQAIKTCADGLKALANLKKIVIIWSGQVDRQAMRDPYEPADTGGSAGYGKASVEAASRVITLATDRHDNLYRWFKVINSRDGREYTNKQRLLFDVNRGRIEQLEVKDDDMSEF